jgi:LPS-assembly lipoprotein
MNQMKKAFAAALCGFALTACGFHPRAKLDLPDTLGPVRVQTIDPYSALGLELTTALTRAGATPASGDAPSAILKITSERIVNAPLSIDQFARVREYVTRYHVDFVLQGADGLPLFDPQSIELSREYGFDVNSSAGSPAEQELIERELRRDMEAAILRRIEIVLRHKP